MKSIHYECHKNKSAHPPTFGICAFEILRSFVFGICRILGGFGGLTLGDRSIQGERRGRRGRRGGRGRFFVLCYFLLLAKFQDISKQGY